MKKIIFFLLLSGSLTSVSPMAPEHQFPVKSLVDLVQDKLYRDFYEGELDLSKPGYSPSKLLQFMNKEERSERRTFLQGSIEENFMLNGYYQQLLASSDRPSQQYNFCAYPHHEVQSENAFCRATPCDLIAALRDNKSVVFNRHQNLFIVIDQHNLHVRIYRHGVNGSPLLVQELRENIGRVRHVTLEETTGDILVFKELKDVLVFNRWSYSVEQNRYVKREEYPLLNKNPNKRYYFGTPSHKIAFDQSYRRFYMSYIDDTEGFLNNLNFGSFQKNEQGVYEYRGSNILSQVWRADIEGSLGNEFCVEGIRAYDGNRYVPFCSIIFACEGPLRLIRISEESFRGAFVLGDTSEYWFVIKWTERTILRIGADGQVQSVGLCEELNQLLERFYPLRMAFNQRYNCFYSEGSGQAFRYDDDTRMFTYAPDLSFGEWHLISDRIFARKIEDGVELVSRAFNTDGLSTMQLALLAAIQKKVRLDVPTAIIMHPSYRRDYRAIERYLVPHERVLCQFADDVATTTTSRSKRAREDDVAEGERPAKR